MTASVLLTLYYSSMCAKARSKDKRESAKGRESKNLSKSSIKSISANLHSEREVSMSTKRVVVKKGHKIQKKAKRHDSKMHKHQHHRPTAAQEKAQAKRKSPKRLKFMNLAATRSTQVDEEQTENTQAELLYRTDDGLDDTNLDAPSFEPILWPPSSDEKRKPIAEKIGDESYNTALEGDGYSTALEGDKIDPITEESKAAAFDTRAAAPTSAPTSLRTAVNAEESTIDLYNYQVYL